MPQGKSWRRRDRPSRTSRRSSSRPPRARRARLRAALDTCRACPVPPARDDPRRSRSSRPELAVVVSLRTDAQPGLDPRHRTCVASVEHCLRRRSSFALGRRSQVPAALGAPGRRSSGYGPLPRHRAGGRSTSRRRRRRPVRSLTAAERARGVVTRVRGRRFDLAAVTRDATAALRGPDYRSTSPDDRAAPPYATTGDSRAPSARRHRGPTTGSRSRSRSRSASTAGPSR